MWFCFNDAFLSVVQSTEDPAILLVRARAYEHLRNVFGPKADIKITPHNDYRYRVLCTKPEWKAIVDKRIDNINYGNFKDSVKDNKLHRLYEKFWFDHMIFQNGKNWWHRQQEKYSIRNYTKEGKQHGNAKPTHG